MEQFCGKWELQQNENFGAFLDYYQYPWMLQKLALISNIDVNITLLGPLKLRREIDSTFYKKTEDCTFDNSLFVSDEGFHKRHRFEKNQILSDVTHPEKGITFHDCCYIENDKLIVEKTWEKNGNTCLCRQIYVKKSE